jgi:beta-1,4-mannooligosaccharide/beta-1,4-mannosyl-N-acetylglucosamine phosphorylase
MAKFTWKGSSVITRHGPVLRPEDVPWPCHMAYNAGIVKRDGRYAMLFRNIYWNERYGKSTRSIGRAFSDDGITWDVDPDFRFKPEGITNPEDPRMTICEGRVYVTFTENSRDGIRGCIAVTDDFENYEILSMSAPDNRNMVLFPEKSRDGRYLRLERPSIPGAGGKGGGEQDGGCIQGPAHGSLPVKDEKDGAGEAPAPSRASSPGIRVPG